MAAVSRTYVATRKDTSLPDLYPVVIPGLLGQLHKRYGNTAKDAAILGACLNGACSLSVSGVAKVERDTDSSTLGLNSAHASFAPSSSGKSVHFRRAIKPMIVWEEKKRVHQREERHTTKTKHHTRDSKISALKAALGKEFISDGDISGYEAKIHDVVRDEPAEVAASALMQSNVTGQALLRQLACNPISGLMTAEGNQVLDKFRAEDFSTINSALESEPMTFNRVASGVTPITNPLLTILLATQPSYFQNFKARHGELFNNTGLGARFLCTISAEAWVNTEIITPDTEDDHAINQRYFDRSLNLLDIMDSNVLSGMEKMIIVKRSAPAKTRIAEFRRQTNELQGSGRYPNCSGFIGKMVDHAARLSAMWHVFEDREGDVSSEYVESAIQLVLYHLEIHRMLHAQPEPARDEVHDSQLLLDILCDMRRNERPLTRAELMNLAFNVGISSAARFGNALGLLGAEGTVQITRSGHIHLSVSYLPPLNITSNRFSF